MRALLLRNMHMGRAKLPVSPELGSCKAQGLPDEECGLRCFCNKRLANYLLGLARWKNKHNVAARADRLMWGIDVLVGIVESNSGRKQVSQSIGLRPRTQL